MAWCAHARAAEPESYELAMTRSAPTIDGVLDDACWRSATVVDRFVKLGGKPLTGEERVVTRAKLIADQEHLYVAVYCEEPLIDKLSMRYTERDSAVWKDDDVEVMLVPCERGEDRYVQLAVNPAGALMDAFLPGQAMPLELGYDSGAAVKTVVGESDWTVEMRLPLANLPIESVTGPWSFRFLSDIAQDAGVRVSRANGLRGADRYREARAAAGPERVLFRPIHVRSEHLSLRGDRRQGEADLDGDRGGR